MQYFGTRAELLEKDGISILLIKKVMIEDKGTYRCYLDGGDERDFLEINFYPQYPDESLKCSSSTYHVYKFNTVTIAVFFVKFLFNVIPQVGLNDV